MNKLQGFAAMDKELQKQLASKGGKSLAAKVDMKELGRRGGIVSGERRRMHKKFGEPYTALGDSQL